MLRQNKAIWVSLAVIGFIILAGAAGVSIQASEPVSKYPNDRANHHPMNPND